MAHHLSGGEYQAKRYGRHHTGVFPAGSFRGPQGYIIVLALDLQWANVCRCIDRTDLLEDPRYQTLTQRAEHQDELIPLIEGWMATFETDQEVLDELERHHVPAGPVLSPLEAMDHPYFKSRDMVRWVDDPRTGPIPIPGFPFKFSDQPELPALVASDLGEHNSDVLTRRLGLSEQRITELTEAGVLYQRVD
jgi:formyl-CoA transferase